MFCVNLHPAVEVFIKQVCLSTLFSSVFQLLRQSIWSCLTIRTRT